MKNLGLCAGMCFSVEAQTINVITLGQSGAQTVLKAAKKSTEQRNASSAIAVDDPADDLLVLRLMIGVRPASADLVIDKA